MKSRWATAFLVIGLMVATVSTAALYATSKSDVYSSNAIIALTPRKPAAFGATNLRLAATRYVALLSSAQTMRSVAASTGIAYRKVVGATKVSVQPNTVTIEITTTLT